MQQHRHLFPEYIQDVCNASHLVEAVDEVEQLPQRRPRGAGVQLAERALAPTAERERHGQARPAEHAVVAGARRQARRGPAAEQGILML